VGSYGRGIFVTNIFPLQEMNEQILVEDIHLFNVRPIAQRVPHLFGAGDYLFGDSHIITPNEPNAVTIHYYLKSKAGENAKVTITDPSGQELATLEGKTNAGLNSVSWDMRRQAARQGQRPAEPGRMRQAGPPYEQWVPPGEYVATLELGGKKLTQIIRITKTIGWSIGPFTEIIR